MPISNLLLSSLQLEEMLAGRNTARHLELTKINCHRLKKVHYVEYVCALHYFTSKGCNSKNV